MNKRGGTSLITCDRFRADLYFDGTFVFPSSLVPQAPFLLICPLSLTSLLNVALQMLDSSLTAQTPGSRMILFLTLCWAEYCVRCIGNVDNSIQPILWVICGCKCSPATVRVGVQDVIATCSPVAIKTRRTPSRTTRFSAEPSRISKK